MRFFAFLLFLSPCLAFAQRDKEFQILIGAGIGGYQTLADYALQFDNVDYTFRDTSGAATKQLHIGVRYELHHRIALGLDFRRGRYIYDPEEDNSGKANSFGMFGLSAEFNIVSRPQFRWNVSLGYHGAGLTITEPLFEGVQEYKGTTHWRGGGMTIQTGIIAYIAKSPFGLTFDIGYDGNSFDLHEYTIDGEKQNLDDWDVSLTAQGVLIQAGIICRLNAFGANN